MSHTDAQNMSHTDAQNMPHIDVFWIIFYKFPSCDGDDVSDWSDDTDDDTNN